ncbi:MAG TPA: Calx-beta domain-containing protein [Gemmataceae bacterium]|nr:Calx-beta domain-containing protein [Gemmataceae bacterium]
MRRRLLRDLQRVWKFWNGGSRSAGRSRPRPRIRPQLEALEDRTLPAFPGTNGLIAFSSIVNGPFGPHADIFTMNPDGTNLVNLTNSPRDDAWATWSPDGTKIAFASNRDGDFEIYVMNADGTNQVRLTNNNAIDYQPTWSPDSTQIAFTSLRDGNAEIYVIDTDGTNETRLTNNLANDLEPTWSPDGTKIVFTSDRDGNFEIYVMNPNGTGQTNITNNPAADTEADWSPDGSRFAFASNRDGNGEIYVMNADGSGVTRLTFVPAVDLGPAWSPDGTQIVFTSVRDGQDEIYLMNADGTNQVRLTNNPESDFLPTWQPTGNPPVMISLPADPGEVVPPAGIPPTVGITNAATIEGGAMVFAVALSAPSTEVVAISYLTNDAPPNLAAPFATATANLDYQQRSGLLIFQPGEVVKTILVPAIADRVPEPNEVFANILFLPINALIAELPPTTTKPEGNPAFGKITNQFLDHEPPAIITEFTFPPGTGHVGGIVIGPDGAFWATAQFDNSIVRFDPRDLSVREFKLPLLPFLPGSKFLLTNEDPEFYPHYIIVGPDGNLWFTGLNDVLARFNLTTLQVDQVIRTSVNSSPHFVLIGPDGNLWFSEQAEEIFPEPGGQNKTQTGMGRIARFDLTTMTLTEFPNALPDNHPQFGNLRIGNRMHGLGRDAGADGIAGNADDNLWAGLEGFDLLARFDLTTQTFVEFVELPADSGPHDILLGPDNNLYLVLQDANLIGQFNPVTRAVRTFAVPGLSPQDGPSLVFLAVGPDNRSIWFSEFLNDRVGKLDLATGQITQYSRGIIPGSAPIGIITGPDGNIWFTETVLDLRQPGRIARLIVPPGPFRFDFGTADSPIALGFAQVTETTVYNPVQGFGWQSGTIRSVDRGSPNALEQDFNSLRQGTFAVDLPNGEYLVTVTLGDALARRDRVEVLLEGTSVARITTRAGQFATRTFRVPVADGQLNLTLRDRGGRNRIAALNALEIAFVDPNSRRFDFGTSTSPVQAGFLPVTDTTVYSVAQGFGWQSGVIQALDRSGPDDLRRDANVTSAGTFAVDLPDGTYFVTLTLGDAAQLHDRMAIFLEGTKVDTVTTPAGRFVTRVFRVTVADGQLTLGLVDNGGRNLNAIINALEIQGA